MTIFQLAILVVISLQFTSIESGTVKLAPFPNEAHEPTITVQQQETNDLEQEQIKTVQQEESIQQQTEINGSECNDDLKVIAKSGWGGRSPKQTPTHLVLPAKKVIIQSTYTNKCTTQETCSRSIRAIQANHMNTRKWNDIGYNFLVGGDGKVYVGRGWEYEGAHTRGHNRNSICIAFIGNFDTTEPPKRQLCAAQNLIAEGIEKSLLSNDYHLYGHRQLVAGTQSPGTALYEIIQTWDHWAEQVEN